MPPSDPPLSASQPQQAAFVTTHWSVVLAAGQGDSPGAADALEKLCRAYWYPLYAQAYLSLDTFPLETVNRT
jgi:hypothetical protein